MDFTLISVLADSAAAFGVIGSLIFVGFQVRQSSKGQRFAAVQSQTAMFQDMVAQLIETSDMAEIVWQGMQDPDKLEGASRMRFDVVMNNVLRAGQSIHWEWKHGVFDDELFAGLTRGFQNFAALPGFRTVWGTRHDQYTHDYQAYIDDMVALSEGKAKYEGWALT